MNKNDFRVKKTQESLQNALLKLIKKYTLDEITIKELASEAMISRQTFYLHYDTKEDLYQATVESFFSELNKKVYNDIKNQSLKTKEDMFRHGIKRYINAMSEISVLISVKDKDLFMKSIKKPSLEMASKLGLRFDNQEDEMVLDLMLGTTYVVFCKFRDEKEKETAILNSLCEIYAFMSK